MLRRCSSAVFTTRFVRGFLISGMVSSRVPRGMTALPMKDSEAIVEEIAEAYVNMDLQTMTAFQKKALKHMAPSLPLEEAILQGMGGGGGMASPAAVAAPAVEAEKAESATPSAKKGVEKQAFDVTLKKYPAANKVKLIKELRSVCNMAIQDAKAAIEKCPGVIATNVPKDDAAKLKKTLRSS